MRRTPRLGRTTVVAAVLVAAALALSAGCAKKAEETALKPTIQPPAIGKAGVLRVAMDLSYPPYGAKVDGENVGLDVDIASAIAERLGLKLEIVETAAAAAPQALADSKADIALGGLQMTEDLLTQVTFAGTYLTDGPAFFAKSSEEPTLSLTSLGDRRPAVQQDSPAYWALEQDLGSEIASAYPTLRDAFKALDGGQAQAAAGDAVVGAYIARDFSGIRFSGQIGPAVPVGVAVNKDASELEAAVRGALDKMAADGVLDAIRTKWLGDLPALNVEQNQGT